jgi:hypothetical protein
MSLLFGHVTQDFIHVFPVTLFGGFRINKTLFFGKWWDEMLNNSASQTGFCFSSALLLEKINPFCYVSTTFRIL